MNHIAQKGQLVAELVELHQWISQSEKVEIEWLEAEAALRQRNRELELLNQIILASASETEPRAILEVACRELAQAFQVPQVAATLLNADKSAAVVVAEYLAEGRPPVLNETIPVKGNSWFQYLLTHKAPLVVADAQHQPRLESFQALMRQRGVASLLMVPLAIEGEVIGSLSVNADEAPCFSAAEVSLIWNVADQVAGALARARLAQTHQQLNTAIEQTAESVVILDTQGSIVYVNSAFERTTGYSRAEAIGQTLDILRSHKCDPTFFEKLWATISAGKVWRGRIVNRKKDGTIYTDETTITPIRDEQGTIVNYVEVKRDVTHEVQLEEQLRQSQKMEAVGQLTAGIAHEFNNLVTAINGFAELAQLQLSPDHPVQKLVSKVRQSSQSATGLIRQLLAFSHTQVIEPTVLDLNAVVAEMSKMLERTIGEHIELVARLTPDLWSVKVDPAHIEQVIVNLVVNARDAMPTGGRLRIETANVVLDEDYVAGHVEATAGEYVLLAVSDTGVGMGEEVKAHLFEPFFTTKARGKGTGLGLATVYGIVRHSAGHIWVDSEPGKGATFKIYLPRCKEASASAIHPKGSRDLPLGGETVLVVEDDDPVREMARLILEQQGYRTLDAKDGYHALQVAADHSGPIHLLLTDVVMPGMSGKELADSLAKSQQDLKTLYISGYRDETIAQHGLLQPGSVVLQKPFGPIDLARKVRKVLDNSCSIPQ